MMATSRGRGVKEMIDPVKPTNMSSLWRGAGVGGGRGGTSARPGSDSNRQSTKRLMPSTRLSVRSGRSSRTDRSTLRMTEHAGA